MADNYWSKLMGDDEHAASYMETYGEGPGALTRHELGKFINDGESVLDVGCGPGWNYEHFMTHGPKISKYLGLDYSERFVRVANQRNPGQYQVGDLRNLFNQSRNEYDVVVMQDALEHTNGYEKPVAEALRVAKQRAIFTFWHLTDDDNPHINDDGDDGWGAWYDKRQWEKFLDTLDYPWLHHQFEFPEGRVRDFYIVDKAVIYG
jgi:SAM-dependent methyltransferase